MAGWYGAGAALNYDIARQGSSGTAGLQAQIAAVGDLNKTFRSLRKDQLSDEKIEAQKRKNAEAIAFSKMSDDEKKNLIKNKLRERSVKKEERNNSFLHKVNPFASDSAPMEGYDNLGNARLASGEVVESSLPSLQQYGMGIGADTATLQGIDKYKLQKKQYDIAQENIKQQGLYRTAQANAQTEQFKKVNSYNDGMKAIALAKEQREKKALSNKVKQNNILFKKANTSLDNAAYQAGVTKKIQQFPGLQEAIPTSYIKTPGSTTYTPIKGQEANINLALDKKYKEYSKQAGYEEKNAIAIQKQLEKKYGPDLIEGYKKKHPGTRMSDTAIANTLGASFKGRADVWKDQATKELQSNSKFFTAKVIPEKKERVAINDFMKDYSTKVKDYFKTTYGDTWERDPQNKAAYASILKKRKELFLTNTAKENAEALKLAAEKLKYKVEQEKNATAKAVAAKNSSAKVKVANIKKTYKNNK